MAGRGYGKTRVGAEGVRRLVDAGTHGRVSLIGRTGADVRDVMVEGESGLLACYPRWSRPEYQPSKRRIVFQNGAIGSLFSADKPDQLRGPQSDLIWGDEISTWAKMLCVSIDTGKPTAEGALTNALLGLRLGNDPRALLTGTPKPTRDMKHLVRDGRYYLIKGTTYDNLGNLANVFRDIVIGAYEGTRAGRQELNGELLEDVEGALLSVDDFDWDGFRQWDSRDIVKIIVSVDPAVTSKGTSDHTGICVIGVGPGSIDVAHAVVLHSERFKGSPDALITRACDLFDEFGASEMVGEANNGGDFIKTTVKLLRPDVALCYRDVHASQGKYARADPVATLYQRKRVHHLGSPQVHAALETEWTTWTAEDDESPDVMDSAVWGITSALIRQKQVIGRPRRVRQ